MRPPVRPIVTARLLLQPVTASVARAVVAGDLSGLACGEGWPHDDTVDAMGLSVRDEPVPNWFIVRDDLIVGDCGTFGWPDAGGVVEIGYGLARPSRGQGYGTEAVRAMTTWLFGHCGAQVIVAGTEASNAASQRLLAKVGFTVTRQVADEIRYALAAPAGMTHLPFDS